MGKVICVLAAILLGGAFGGFRSWSEFEFSGERFQPFDPAADAREGDPMPELTPAVAVLNGEHYRFGTMQRGTKLSHRFLIKNVGDAPLKVWCTT